MLQRQHKKCKKKSFQSLMQREAKNISKAHIVLLGYAHLAKKSQISFLWTSEVFPLTCSHSEELLFIYILVNYFAFLVFLFFFNHGGPLCEQWCCTMLSGTRCITDYRATKDKSLKAVPTVLFLCQKLKVSPPSDPTTGLQKNNS